MITSTENPRIKAYAKLKTARERRKTGLFLIEGHREVQRALAAGVEIDVLIVCPALLGSGLDPSDTETLEVAETPMRRIAIREHPPGVIAVARQFPIGLADLEVGASALLLIAEGMEKPGNIGAMMRTCDAAGATMIVTDGATDVYNPNVIRASQGSVFSIPLAVASAAETIEWCRERSVTVVGGYPTAGTELWDAPLNGSCAVVVGAEDVGISPIWDGITTPVRIPMAGTADSLNASVSAAILLFEAVRQRRS